MPIQNCYFNITRHHLSYDKLLNDDMGVQDELYFVKEPSRYVETN